MYKKSILKSMGLLAVIAAVSLAGYGVAFGYGGVVLFSGGGGGAGANTPMAAINYPLSVYPTQSGTFSRNFGDQSSAEINVPSGAVNSQTTFDVTQSVANANEVPANTTGAFMIGNRVFNITATDINNNAVRDFNGNLNITITLPGMPANTTGLDIYYYNDTTKEWVIVPGAVFNSATGKVTFQVNHLTKFAAIKGNGQERIKTIVSAQTLGIKEYSEGSLLRTPDWKVYIVSCGEPRRIYSAEELKWHAGKPIYNVDYYVIETFGQGRVLGAKIYAEGTLVRVIGTQKIYVIVKGERVHVRTLDDLRNNYLGRTIFNVEK